MVEVSTITATLGAAITALKEIGKVAEKTKDRELNRLVLELQQSMMTANTQLLGLATENQQLQGRILTLEHIGEIEKELVYRDSVYWRQRNGGADGPYCQVCWDDAKKLIRLNPGATAGTYGCGVCKESYWTSKVRSGSHFQGPPPFDQM